MRRRPLCGALLTAAVLLGTVSACAGSGPEGPVTVAVWAHSGTDAERRVLHDQVADFNASQHDVHITLRLIAEGDYGDTLQAAMSGATLPDVAEVDGPLLASAVYQGAPVPLEDLVDQEVLDGQLPSLRSQDVLDGHQYAVAAFDSGLGLYADRRALRAAGVHWPRTIDDAWTAGQFRKVLAQLAAHDPDRKVLDVKENYGTGEWLTYGFAPLVASAGGSLVDPVTLSPLGRMDGRAARTALRDLRSWSAYVDPNADDKAFVHRRVALSWVGHWTYPDYAAALGRDLLVLPLPDLGHGTKTGQGSWTWTITARSHATQAAAARFLDYLMADDQVLRMTDANGAVPGTVTALDRSRLYSRRGPLRIFAEQLLRTCGSAKPSPRCVATPRPRTPGYPVLTSQFAAAVAAALAGKDPVPALRSGAAYADKDRQASLGCAADGAVRGPRDG